MADGNTCKGTRRDAKSAVEENSKELQEKFEPVLARLGHEIEQTFSNSIETKMANGVTSAMSSANDTVAKWGAKQNKEVRSDGGLHWKTYQCTVRRQGVYNSKTYGNIDFNEELSEPMYRCISVCWDQVFSGLLWRSLEDCKSLLLMTLTIFVRELCGKLNNLEVSRTQTDGVSAQLCHSAKDKLAEMLTNLKELVLSRQRDISRVITPTVQSNLDQTYIYCGGEAGSGMFMRMKQAMAEAVDYKRVNMFGQASKSLLQELTDLKKEIVAHVRSVCLSLCLMLQAAFEPLWEAPSQTKLLKDILFESVTDAVLSVTSLHTDANLTLPVAPARAPSPEQDSFIQDDQIMTDQANQNSHVSVPGPSSLQVATTTPVGPQMYIKTCGITQRLVTDAHGKAQHISLETSQSALVTDVLKHLKQEPGSTNVISSASIKKEWEPSSNLQEVSGPELRWLQNSLPGLDWYTNTVSSGNQAGKMPVDSAGMTPSLHGPQPYGTLRSVLSPGVSSTITRPADSSQPHGTPRCGLSPGVSSTITKPAGSSQPHGTPRCGLSPGVSSTITKPAGSSQLHGTTRCGLSPGVSSTITQPAGSSQPHGTLRCGLSPGVSSTITKPAGSSQLHGTLRCGLSPGVSSTITKPAGSSQLHGTTRCGLSPGVSSTITKPAGSSQLHGTMRCGLSPGVSSTITKPAGSSESVGTSRSPLSSMSLGNASTVSSLRSQGKQQTKPKPVNTNSKPQVYKLILPRVSNGGNILLLSSGNNQNQQANNHPTVVQGRNDKGLSSSNASKMLVNKNLVAQLQTQKQSTTMSSSHSLNGGDSSSTKQNPTTRSGPSPSGSTSTKHSITRSSDSPSTNPNPTTRSCDSPSTDPNPTTRSSHSPSGSLSTSDRSSGITNSPPVTGPSSSNRGRLRLSLRKTLTSDSPLKSSTHIKQEQVDGNPDQQRRVRRANNSSCMFINLSDSDSEN